MRHPSTIILTLVVVLLGLYLFLVELPNGDKQSNDVPVPAPLLSLAGLKVTGITLKNSDRTEIVLTHLPDDPKAPWRIVKPIEAVADSTKVAAFLAHLRALVGSRKVEEHPDGVAPYGLAPPAYTILIAVNQTDAEALDIGAENLDKTERYAQKGPGSPVWLIPAEIGRFLNTDIQSWTAAEQAP